MTQAQKAFVTTAPSTGDTNDLTLPSPAQREEFVFTIGNHYYKPEILGVDSTGNIVFNSKGETLKVSPAEYGDMTTLRLQNKEG